MAFKLSITKELFAEAETGHSYDDVLAAADEVSSWYRCYQAWHEQIDDRLYDKGTSTDDEDRYYQAIEPILHPPQIEYGSDEWFPLHAWAACRGRYNSAIERIREALLV